MTHVPEKLCGIIGHPLGHSLSPLLHNRAFELTGFPGVYMSWPMPPERLTGFLGAVRALPIWGVSVTIPHKEAVMDACEELTAEARDVGAVNTLYWQDGRLWGDNTDVSGFMAPLEAHIRPGQRALVLGAGGAARAVLAGLRRLGLAGIAVASRTMERTETLCREFGCTPVAWEDRVRRSVDLLVNATPLGMQGEREKLSPWPADAFGLGLTVYDLVYRPLRTRFVREAESAGCAAVTGLEMFLGQAARQFTRWTGLAFPANEARELLRGVLDAGEAA